MNANWFSEAVSGKPQTEEYILQRMALTLSQPDHDQALRRSCHQLAAREIGRLHDEDKLTSDHQIVMLGLGPTIYHTIITNKDDVVFDSLGTTEGNRYDAEKGRYFSGTFSGHMMVKHTMGVDDFFKNYVAKIIPSQASSLDRLGPVA